MNNPLSNMNNSSGISEQPDPDFIKMFVGQIPRSMDENDLRKMFEEFGRVHQINVLRDKVTGQSKGRQAATRGNHLSTDPVTRLVFRFSWNSVSIYWHCIPNSSHTIL
jgi:RNA recognition motif-containing protein